MRKAAKLFYLAVFGLLATTGHASNGRSVNATKPKTARADVCAIEPRAIVSDACASYGTLDQLNNDLQPYIHSLTHETDFFSYYRLNLYNKKCPFWSDEAGMCGNIACAVNTIEDEQDIPLIWRAEELGKLEGPKAEHPGKKQQKERQQRPLQGSLGENVGESCVVEYDDECDERDYCVPEDESATAKGDYVSLVDNPERFTGYSGPSAHQVWEAIYRENCFSKPSPHASSSGSPPSNNLIMGNQAQAAQDLRSIMREHGRQQALAIHGPDSPAALDDGFDIYETEECLEKRVFYRVISGMHASISTHLCHSYLNQSTGTWGPNLTCYEQRLHSHPERISNLYFNYALLLRAFGKLRHHLQSYTFCSGDLELDAQTKDMVTYLAQNIPNGAKKVFDESIMFPASDATAIALKDDFKNRFRNVSRIMDCVGCDKCRLWGKLQTSGLGTALKVLFEFEEGEGGKDTNPPLRRTELVALVNTLDKISASLSAIADFEAMIERRDKEGKPMGGQVVEKIDEAATREVEVVDVDDGFDEDLGFDETEDDEEELDISEIFWEEWRRVWKAFGFVLSSWAALPGKMIQISAHELGRLWDNFLGIPVGPRRWKLDFYPNFDEL
ncbi:endoplasmic oxidoreductin [Viridothelium virens]|uniref:Endoplasmic oxidoreductin n=1 Tax=Viridothelium virens TaxID=1048519 RepID=A0A6A6HAY2_VIRVR|nr:endoplasmic oxidoreductin [Viridothelium virens]